MVALTWGLDVSTNKGKTAAVALDWSTDGEARVVDVRRPLAAAEIAPLISEHRESRWAVDVPFGWPDLFVDLMGVSLPLSREAGDEGVSVAADSLGLGGFGDARDCRVALRCGSPRVLVAGGQGSFSAVR